MVLVPLHRLRLSLRLPENVFGIHVQISFGRTYVIVTEDALNGARGSGFKFQYFQPARMVYRSVVAGGRKRRVRGERIVPRG